MQNYDIEKNEIKTSFNPSLFWINSVPELGKYFKNFASHGAIECGP